MPGDVISRPRLFALLDQKAPLTLVRGACGAGKTVLLHDWVRTADDRVVWLTAGADGADSDRLAIELLRRLDVRSANAARAGWRGVREALADFRDSLVIIVDDAALLSRKALVHLCETVAAVPNVRVIAAANRRTVLDDDGVALMLDRLIIGPAELMFDEDEIQRALGGDAESARRVRALTSGFPALIHAMAKRGGAGDAEALLEVSAEAVEEYMRMRVARSGYNPTVIATLVKASFADELDVALARELTADPDVDVAGVLDDAEHYGFGAWSSDARGAVFRFAPFARLLLRRELERAYADDLPRMRRATAKWALGRRRPDVALRIAVADDADLALARDVVIASWYQLLNHGHTVRTVLGAIPISTLKQEPLLVMLLAVCYNAVRVRRVRGLQLFRIAVSAANARDSDLSSIDRIFIWVAESVALRLLGMHDRAAGVATRALKLLVDTPEEEKEGYAEQIPLLCAQLGISLYYGGDHRAAIECFSFGAALAATGENEHAISNLAMLSGIHAINGDIPEARHYVELIRSGRWGRRYLDGYQGTFYRVAEAILALEESDAPRAAEHVRAFEHHRATSEHWLTMALIEALVSLRRRQPALGVAQLESLVQLRGREGTSSSARRSLSRPRLLLQLGLGNTTAAKAILDKDSPEDRYETIVERARIALIENRPRDTLRILQSRVAPSTSRLRASAGALRTAALIRTGGPGAARHEVQALSALLRDRGLRWPLSLLPPADARAVIAMLREDSPQAFETAESVLPESVGVPPLTDRELVVLRALTSGDPLQTIAADLGVSLNTVKTQVKSVYRKLGVASREEAVAAAVARDLLSDHD